MARSENQGLQIAVILFTMLTVGLSISTYMYYASYEKERDARKQAQDAKKTSEDNLSAQTARLKAYEYVLGKTEVTRDQVDADRAGGKLDSFAEDVIKTYDKQMALFSEAAAEGTKTYPTLPNYLTIATEQRGQQIVDQRKESDRKTVEVQEVTKRESDRAAKAEEALQAKIKELGDVQTAFQNDRAAAEKTMNDLKAQLAAQIAALKKQKDADEKEKTAYIEKIGKLEQMLVSANQEIAVLRKNGPDFESPDGQVTWINQKERLVWIDVGNDDGLSRQTTFSVYDHDENGVSTTAKPKAKIEVIRVLEAHLAECRILKDEIKNPILPGDRIFTPAWSPGQRIHFAMCGLLDIDGDGRGDNGEIRNIIAINNGIVDAEVSAEGKRTGSMSHQTRYLIRGKAPSERELSGEEGKKALAAYGNLLDDAEKYGAEIIDLSRFLGMMGWKAQERTLSIGEKRVSDRTRNGQFKERRPGDSPASSGKSSSADAGDDATPIKPKGEKPVEKPAATEEDDPFK